MNVADAMTPREDLVTVSLPGTREDVLTYLQERSFSSVPVVKPTEDGDGETFRGLVTREALIEQPDEDQLALLVEEVPTTPLFSVDPATGEPGPWTDDDIERHAQDAEWVAVSTEDPLLHRLLGVYLGRKEGNILPNLRRVRGYLGRQRVG